MGNETDVGFVDPHAEGNGGHHDDAGFAQKTVLAGLPVGVVHAGMVGQRVEALGAKKRAGLVDLFAGQAIDDTAFAPDDDRER